MTSPFIPSSFSYNDAPAGGQPMPMVIAPRNPSNTIDKQYPAGYLWLSSLDLYTVGPGGVLTYGSGNIYYQAGNTSGSPNWILVSGPSVSNSAAGATPQTANGRSFSVAFSSVSIAGGATQSFTIANSYITASSRISYSMVGATTGAALTIQSVTNTAGQSVIVVSNGTGATTTIANITFTGIILA